MAKIELSTTIYEFTHGKKPRGAFNCGWYFKFQGDAETRSFNGIYTVARAAAIKYAKEKGYTNVSVAP